MLIVTHFVCLSVGAMIGIFLAGLMAAAKRGDEK